MPQNAPRNRELLSPRFVSGRRWCTSRRITGSLIVLMNDAQTTGGYPRTACIIEADKYHLAQIPPGQPILVSVH
ncbi:hypothetical protein O5623_30600 [Escherichia coli]|nr:hypothetical protein [Escherichia coli]